MQHCDERVPRKVMATERIKSELREIREGDKPYIVVDPNYDHDVQIKWIRIDGVRQHKWRIMMPGPPHSP